MLMAVCHGLACALLTVCVRVCVCVWPRLVCAWPCGVYISQHRIGFSLLLLLLLLSAFFNHYNIFLLRLFVAFFSTQYSLLSLLSLLLWWLAALILFAYLFIQFLFCLLLFCSLLCFCVFKQRSLPPRDQLQQHHNTLSKMLRLLSFSLKKKKLIVHFIKRC